MTPVLIPGASNENKTCAAQGFTQLELKQDNVNSNPGTYTVSGGGFSVTLTVPSALDLSTPPPGEKKNSLDFTAGPGTLVFGVIVKNGEDGANLYDYRPAGTTGDQFLTTPNGGAKGISHVTFCVGPRPGKVTIVKDAKPNHAQDFGFTGAGTLSSPSSFILDDDADGTRSNTQVYGGLTTFGLGTVGETTVSGWDLALIACTDAAGAVPATVRYGTGSGAAFAPGANGDAFGIGDTTVEIDVKAGVDVTCTFTNKQVVLDLVKVPSAATVSAGDDISFTLQLSNSGPGTARGVELTDNLPAGVTWTIVSQPAGDPCSIAPPAATSGQVLTCDFGDLGPGTVGVVVGASTSENACGVYDNTATVTATNAPGDTANASITCLAPSLSVVKTPDGQTVTAGSAVSFTMVTSNGGPGIARGVTLNDPLPAGLDWSISAQTNAGECSIAGAVGSEVLSCTYGDLGSGASRSVTVTATTSASACGVYDNTATVDATNAPPDSDAGQVRCEQPPPPPPPPPGPQQVAGQVAPVTGQQAPIVRGTARLRGPSGCPRQPRFRVYVTGRQIQSVRFTRGTRTLGTVRRPDRLGRWIISVSTEGLRPGTHRIRAHVTFRPESQTRARTLQLRFSICAAVKGERARGFTG